MILLMAVCTGFNSYMVQLKAHQSSGSAFQILYFNSYMVQLKDNSIISVQQWAPGFQFLYGAIKSLAGMAAEAGNALFQFLYGAIKSGMWQSSLLAICCFNSSMVQLKD